MKADKAAIAGNVEMLQLVNAVGPSVGSKENDEKDVVAKDVVFVVSVGSKEKDGKEVIVEGTILSVVAVLLEVTAEDHELGLVGEISVAESAVVELLASVGSAELLWEAEIKLQARVSFESWRALIRDSGVVQTSV